MFPFEFIQGSIKYKIVLLVIVTITTIVSMFQFYGYAQDKEYRLSHMQHMSQGTLVRLTENLVLPLWEIDEGWVEKIILSEMLEPSSYAITVVGEGGLFVGKSRNKHSEIVDVTEVDNKELITFEGKVIRDGTEIGSVKLYVSNKIQLAALNQKLLINLISTLALIFLTSIALIIMLTNIVLTPLKSLLKSSNAIADGDYNISVKVDSNDEISFLADGLDKMKESIQSREKELSAALVELENKSEMLEQDIAHRKRIEEALARAKENAEKASKAKTEFLASMSHDLRTPLNAIMGFSDMMRQEAFGPFENEHYKEYVNDIHHSGSLLVSLINDVLDLSKVEAGKYDLVNEPLDVKETITISTELLSAMAERSGQRLSVDVQSGMPQLLGDERVMTQILNNLISNAIKFTPHGGSVSISAEVNENNEMRIYVKDTGVGMSPKNLEKALMPFEQADGLHSRRHEGTGLGLHLCQNFMKLFGGSLVIESAIGEGTKAILKFPSSRTV